LYGKEHTEIHAAKLTVRPGYRHTNQAQNFNLPITTSNSRVVEQSAIAEWMTTSL